MALNRHNYQNVSINVKYVYFIYIFPFSTVKVFKYTEQQHSPKNFGRKTVMKKINNMSDLEKKTIKVINGMRL